MENPTVRCEFLRRHAKGIKAGSLVAAPFGILERHQVPAGIAKSILNDFAHRYLFRTSNKNTSVLGLQSRI